MPVDFKKDNRESQSILIEDLKCRVLVSREKVKFSQVDAYGHLNSARYLEFMTNHRIEAAEDQLGCYTLDLAKNLNIGFVVVDAHVQFLRPALSGENLEISSWLEFYDENGFSLRVFITSCHSRSVKSIGNLKFRSVGIHDGMPVPMPQRLPSRAAVDPLPSCPLVSQFKTTLKLPKGMAI